jgi:alkylhydroperoxidase family enzyme
MTKFEVHSVETAPEGSRAQLAAVTGAWGFTPKLHEILAESPAALWGFARAVVETRGQAGDAAVAAFLAAGFSRANVLYVVAIVATKTISNYTNHLTHTLKEAFMANPSLAWSVGAVPMAAE